MKHDVTELLLKIDKLEIEKAQLREKLDSQLEITFVLADTLDGYEWEVEELQNTVSTLLTALKNKD